MATPLDIILQNKFIISLVVASIVAVYAWNSIPTDPATGHAVNRGGVALRLFLVTFLSIYLLSYLLENFSSDKKMIQGGGGGGGMGGGGLGGAGSAPSLKAALKNADHAPPNF